MAEDDSQQVQNLLRSANFAQLGTVSNDGTPHIDTVWFDYDDGQFIIATTMATKKARNLAKSHHGYVVVTNRDNPYEQAQFGVELIEIVPDDDLLICDAIANKYTGKPFPQREHPNRVAIRLAVKSTRYHRAKV
jgi:general stress protein 26